MIYPKNDLVIHGETMRMMFATPCEEYKVNDVLVRALDRIFILHADHEQNASTSTVRLCGSSGHQSVCRHRGGRSLPLGAGGTVAPRGGPFNVT